MWSRLPRRNHRREKVKSSQRSEWLRGAVQTLLLELPLSQGSGLGRHMYFSGACSTGNRDPGTSCLREDEGLGLGRYSRISLGAMPV